MLVLYFNFKCALPLKLNFRCYLMLRICGICCYYEVDIRMSKFTIKLNSAFVNSIYRI